MSTSFNNEISFKVSGATIGPNLFVTIDPNRVEEVLLSGVGDMPMGVSQEAQRDFPGGTGSDATIAGKSGDTFMRVVQLGNDCLLTCGGTVSAGNLLKPDSQGRGVSATSGDAYGAVALMAGTVGVKIRVVVMRGKT